MCITYTDLGGQGTWVTMTDSQQQSMALSSQSAQHSHCHRNVRASLPPFPGNLCTDNPLAGVTHTLTLFPAENNQKTIKWMSPVISVERLLSPVAEFVLLSL